MGPLNIPSQFQVLGHTITVHMVDMDKWQHSDCYAYYAPDWDRIYVRRMNTPALEKHAFWHEAVHTVFNLLNRETLYKREVLVDNVGAVLAQIMETAQ